MPFELKLKHKARSEKENDRPGRRTTGNFQIFSLNGHQKFNFSLSFRHKILNMLTKNPPFTKNMESPLCNEALVDQLWKLMNSGKTAVAF